MRLFLAVELDEQCKSQLINAAQFLQARDADIRWVLKEQLHLTIKFLGSVDEDRLEEIKACLPRITEPLNPFEMAIAGVGCFPARGAVRIIWAGVQESAGALSALARSAEDAFAEHGFAREKRDFSPHITLGRVRSDNSRGQLREEVSGCHIKAILQSVNGLTLFRSHTEPTGAVYEVLQRVAF